MILRIETERGGMIGSIPFLWTIPDLGVDGGTTLAVDPISSSVPTHLSLVNGSRTVSPLGNGHLQETWSVLAKEGNTNAQVAVTQLTGMFILAAKLEKNNDVSDRVFLVEQMNDEPEARHSVIYSGAISPVDHGVVTRGMEYDHSLFTITVERNIEWEHGENQIISETIANHGGTFVLPSKFASNGSEGRIQTSIFRTSGGGYLKKMWFGILPNTSGMTRFNPKVSIGSNTNINAAVITNIDTKYIYDTDFYENGKIVCNYASQAGWWPRFNLPMKQWNTDTWQGGEELRGNYVGEWHLILRYRISGDAGATCGVRAGTGWSHSSTITWSDRLYLTPAVDSGGQHHIKYEDLGVINIGGGKWNKDARDRLALESFTIYIESAKLAGNSSTEIEFDTAWLVPANNFLFFNLDGEISSSRMIEIHTDAKGEIFGYIVGRTNVPDRKIYDIVPDIVANNWVMPREEGSILVCVGDRARVQTKTLGSNNLFSFIVKHRTEAFVYTNA